MAGVKLRFICEDASRYQVFNLFAVGVKGATKRLSIARWRTQLIAQKQPKGEMTGTHKRRSYTSCSFATK